MTEKKRILIVDDNDDLLQSFSLVLEYNGYEVDTARDGAAAVEKCRESQYDAVLMDVIMPRMDGLTAFRSIREICPGIKVILMTAYADEEKIAAAMAEGLYRAVGKPITVTSLLEVMEAATDKPSVIIVDDDINVARALSRIFELKGYVSYAVASGEEAIRMVMTEDIGMALVDVKMPVMDGLETAERLKRLRPSIASIIMTAYRDEVAVCIGQALGGPAKGCLYKPFEPNEALGMVSKFAPVK
jgi:CheY-like chemotaxis protein